MFNTAADFAVNAIAFALVFILPVVALYLWAQLHKARKALEDSRQYALGLQEEIAGLNYKASILRAINKDLRAINKDLVGELVDSIEFGAGLLQEIEDRKARPLHGLSDSALVEVVRKELTHRVEHRCLVEYAFGPSDDPIWKIASKVGGAAFRVVDKAKRGKLTVQG